MTSLRPLVTLAACSLIYSVVLAQPPMGMSGPPPGANAKMAKFFGDIKAFSAKAETRVLDKSAKETVSMTMAFAMLDGKTRTELDLTQMKSAQMPPGGGDMMKQMGMDKMVTLSIPNKKTAYLIYPTMKAYAEMPMSEEETASSEQDLKIEKTSLGKETIDGHDCTKNKVTITNKKGEKSEATVWNAADLKDFPIQMQMTEKDTTIITRYKDIQFAKPDEKQFNPPEGFTRHTSMQQLMQAAMQKMMGGLGGNK